MTYHQFWYEEPKLLESYQKAYYRKLHEEAHIYGYYYFIGVSTALANAFRKKGEKAQEYIQKPIEVFKKRQSKQEVQREYERGRNYQMNWVNALSSNK